MHWTIDTEHAQALAVDDGGRDFLIDATPEVRLQLPIRLLPGMDAHVGEGEGRPW